MKEAIRAAIEALDGLIWYVGQLETLVYSDDDKGEHEQVTAAESALSLLRAALEGGEEPTDADLERMAIQSGLDEELWFGQYTPKGYEDSLPKLRRFAQAARGFASPIAADVQRDAERYRWWREYAMQTEDVSADDAFIECETPQDVDAVIDAALREAMEGGK